MGYSNMPLKEPTEPNNPGGQYGRTAALYDQLRPGYPAQIIDTLLEVTDTQVGDQILEIGAGTGQATIPLAQRGHHLTAIELSDEQAEIARKNLATSPKVSVVTGAFEEITLPENAFDLVFSATAFHWIRPEYRFSKTSRILKPLGYLAILRNEPIAGSSGDEFFRQSHKVISGLLRR